jgi:hypothetical protein
LQRIIFDENFLSLGYLGVVAMGVSNNFAIFIPLVLLGYLELCEYGKGMLDRNPNTPIVSMMKE